MKPNIRLLADYKCWPLWHHKDKKVGDIDPREIGVSDALVGDLERWVDVYESHMDWSDPASTQWTNDEVALFDSDGRNLCRRLTEEISDRYQIYYHIPFSSKIIPVEDINEIH